jgi:prolyl-tRNA synthetase
MRLSQTFFQTLRDAPTEAEAPSHQYLLRAGYIAPLAAGIFSYLPLARRTLDKIEAIIRGEMNAIGGQEVTMPVVQPAEIWQQTGRWYSIDAEMGRFKDRGGREMCLAMTHEEAVADLARRMVRSYRQLPRLIYQLQTKFRDDPRPRAGLIRVREFTMKDSYSLDADWDGLDRQYEAHYRAYFNIFRRCGLPVVAVRSDTGMMGGQMAHEFMFLTPIGEDTLLICPACGYSANRQIARFQKGAASSETPRPIEKVATPGTKTIHELALLLGVPESRTAKAVFLIATLPDAGKTREQFIFVVIRGDMDVNETKLAKALQAQTLRAATEAEIRAIGAVPGYASPVGLVKNAAWKTVVDDSIPLAPNLTAGANEDGFHLLHVNYGRDFTADIVADIAAAREGDGCPECGAPLGESRGVEVGNIFKLGTHYTTAVGATFLDKDGCEKPIILGSYGIGVGRLLACVAEAHHDEFGLAWPAAVAPYQVHLVELRGRRVDGNEPNERLAEKIYQELCSAGVETLWDDRDESPGVKFNDADLIGLPIRITVSERAARQGGVELKRRSQPEKTIISLEDLIPAIRAICASE